MALKALGAMMAAKIAMMAMTTMSSIRVNDCLIFYPPKHNLITF
ncbi:MAG: hypothetical protein ABIH45_01485 [Candidatus Omnitrophota bacterium]